MAEPIYIKSPSEIELMRQAGKITAGARTIARQAVHDGISTKQIDRHVHDFITKNGAYPTFLNYNGFPGSACISVNDCLIHGIPDSYRLKEGDIVSIDLGSKYHGFHGDSARTWAVGEIPEETKKLIKVTRQSFFEGIKMARLGNRIGDISHAIGSYAKSFGYGVPLDYTGHGVGRELHESPAVPNDGIAGTGVRLRAGMTLAVEPMITMGSARTYARSDGWYVRTYDGKLCAHYENTFVITDGEPEIFTLLDDEK